MVLKEQKQNEDTLQVGEGWQEESYDTDVDGTENYLVSYNKKKRHAVISTYLRKKRDAKILIKKQSCKV